MLARYCVFVLLVLASFASAVRAPGARTLEPKVPNTGESTFPGGLVWARVEGVTPSLQLRLTDSSNLAFTFVLYGIRTPAQAEVANARTLAGYLSERRLVLAVIHHIRADGTVVGQILLPDMRDLGSQLIRSGYVKIDHLIRDLPAAYLANENEAKANADGIWKESK